MYPNIKTNRKEGERSCKIVNNIEIYICLLTEPSPQPRDLTFILMFTLGTHVQAQYSGTLFLGIGLFLTMQKVLIVDSITVSFHIHLPA